jgi:hypothetical protein
MGGSMTLKQLWQKTFKRNRFVAVQQFLDVDRNPHIIIMTRNQVLEYDPTGKSKLLFTLSEAEKAPKQEQS